MNLTSWRSTHKNFIQQIRLKLIYSIAFIFLENISDTSSVGQPAMKRKAVATVSEVGFLSRSPSDLQYKTMSHTLHVSNYARYYQHQIDLLTPRC